MFSLRNYVHVDEVAVLYEEKYGTSLTTVVTTEFEGRDMGNALVSIRIIYYSYCIGSKTENA